MDLLKRKTITLYESVHFLFSPARLVLLLSVLAAERTVSLAEVNHDPLLETSRFRP